MDIVKVKAKVIDMARIIVMGIFKNNDSKLMLSEKSSF